MKNVTIGLIKGTESQSNWLKSEARRTGSSVSGVIRMLIQEKIDYSEKHHLKNLITASATENSAIASAEAKDSMVSEK